MSSFHQHDDQVPAPGQIAHGSESWSEPAGGGAVAAAQMLKLAGACDFYTALGDDDLGRRSFERLSELGLTARKRGELEVQAARAELAHLSRVATMGELSASLAHETPRIVNFAVDVLYAFIDPRIKVHNL